MPIRADVKKRDPNQSRESQESKPTPPKPLPDLPKVGTVKDPKDLPSTGGVWINPNFKPKGGVK